MLDARLIGPAVAAWIAAIAVVLTGRAHGPDWAWAVAAGVVLLVAASSWVRSAARAPAVAALAGVIAALFQVTALWAGPIADAAQARSDAIVIGVVESEPEPLRGPVWASDVFRVRLATSSIAVESRDSTTEFYDVEVPVELRCQCASAEIGALVMVSGRLAPGRGETAAMVYARDAPQTLRGPGVVDVVADRMRDGLRGAVVGLDPGPGSLVAGLAVGDRTLMPPLLEDDMRDVGLSHLTAVSGGNVAIVVAAALAIAAVVRMRVRARVPFALAVVAGFVVLVRPQPSVVRAAVMAAVVLIALLTGGRRAGPSVLAAAVLVLVIIAPSLAVSWAFALSVAATFGLIVLAPRLRTRLPQRWPPALAEALAITVAAQLATMPVLLAMGATVSWASIPANLLAMPAVPPVTVLGLLAAVTAPLFPGLAHALAWCAAVPAAWIAGIASWAQGLPAADLPWPTGFAGIALLVIAWILVPRLRRRWPRTTAAFIAGIVAIALIDPPGARTWPPPDWRMVACDVGQGDAIVLRGDEGASVLVDTGPDARSLDACLDDLGIDALSAIVLTHFHADHVDGLAAALRRDVGMIVVTPVREPAEQVRDALVAIDDADVPTRPMTAGARLVLPGIRLTALWPARRIDEGSVPNNASIVLAGSVGGLRVLLTGDVEREAQAQIARLPRLPLDVVKTPHHGSSNLDEDFIAWAQAPIAIVSVGEGNPYGHPKEEALRSWSRGLLGRTDTDGALAVVLRDGRPALVRRG